MITLVAVHGNGGGGFRFARVLAHVPDSIRFEAITLPGFGGRPGDPALRTLPDYAEALWREIEHLPRPIVVLGHGIGGSIALDMVQRHDIDGLILHAPVGTRLEKRWFPRLMKPEPVRALIKWGISSRVTRPLIGRRFFSRNVPTDYRNQFLDEYGRADAFSQMFDIITPEWWNGLAPIDVPSLMLWGSDDRVLGADQVADYRALLPQAWTDVVPGWGHFPMVEGPAEYAGTITDWADRLIAGPSRTAAGRLRSAVGRRHRTEGSAARSSHHRWPSRAGVVGAATRLRRRGPRCSALQRRSALRVLVGRRRDHVERRPVHHGARRRPQQSERVQRCGT